LNFLKIFYYHMSFKILHTAQGNDPVVRLHPPVCPVARRISGLFDGACRCGDGRARGTGPGGDAMKKTGRHYYNTHVRTRPVKRELAKGIRERA